MSDLFPCVIVKCDPNGMTMVKRWQQRLNNHSSEEATAYKFLSVKCLRWILNNFLINCTLARLLRTKIVGKNWSQGQCWTKYYKIEMELAWTEKCCHLMSSHAASACQFLIHSAIVTNNKWQAGDEGINSTSSWSIVQQLLKQCDSWWPDCHLSLWSHLPVRHRV